MNTTTTTKIRMAARDYAACLALEAARKADNARRRAAILAHAGLAAVLLDEARRRGETSIDWERYFRNAGI